MDDVERSNSVIDDDLCEAFDVQQTRTQNHQLSLFSRHLAYILAQTTDGAARAIDCSQRGHGEWLRDLASTAKAVFPD